VLVSLQDLRRLEALDAAGAEKPAVHPIMRAFAGWAERDDLDTLTNEIYQNRAATLGREVEL
jgi:hypothetical protein